MLLEIPGVLNEAQLNKVHEILADARFVDGKLTAGMAARRVKNNLEMRQDPKRMEILMRILVSSLAHNQSFNSAVLPLRMADPIFASYRPGMAYGDTDIDNMILGELSCTVLARCDDSHMTRT